MTADIFDTETIALVVTIAKLLRCLIATSKLQQAFHYVEEQRDAFLCLFPHRHDFIWAPHVAPGQSVDWQTESRYPISDRLIQQGSYLYGVRFGAQTRYCLLDIDISSPYHPKQDPFALYRITAALEPLGLVSAVICTSSYSGGLHVYFPFDLPQSSWQIAIALATLLENGGFKLVPGHLEAFPNPKPYVVDGRPSLFNAHRLPLQSGSYLLDDEFQPILSTPAQFVDRWEFVRSRNDLEAATLKQILKQAKRRVFHISGKADKFLNDLNAEIEIGWTGYGQTNRLLGRITMRAYIFHHMLNGGEPLSGQRLINEIVKTARSLPGYADWCQHQHEIEHRAKEWARCIEQSHYFHYGDQHGKFKAKNQALDIAVEKAPTWNQQQSEAARDRIRGAIADLLEKQKLPASIRDRFQALTQYGVGGGSLYKHRDLWHPHYFFNLEESFQEIQHSDSLESDSKNLCALDSDSLELETEIQSNIQENITAPEVESSISAALDSTSLLPSDGRNAFLSNTFNAVENTSQWAVGRNHAPLLELLQSRLRRLDDNQKHTQSRQVAQIQNFLASGDSVLVAEVINWMRQNLLPK